MESSNSGSSWIVFFSFHGVAKKSQEVSLFKKNWCCFEVFSFLDDNQSLSVLVLLSDIKRRMQFVPAQALTPEDSAESTPAHYTEPDDSRESGAQQGTSESAQMFV